MSLTVWAKYVGYNAALKDKIGADLTPVRRVPAPYACQLLAAYVQLYAQKKASASVNELVYELYPPYKMPPLSRQRMITEACAFLRVVRLLCMKIGLFYAMNGTAVEFVLEKLLNASAPLGHNYLIDDMQNLRPFVDVPESCYGATRLAELQGAFLAPAAR